MPTITPNQGLSLPAATDVNNVPVDFDDYNDGVENRLVQRYLSSADRAVRNPTPSKGELSYLASTDSYQAYNGVTWTPVPGQAIARASRASASSASTGAEVPVLRFDNISLVGGRLYQVRVNNVRLRSTVANDIAILRLKYSTVGVATVASPELTALRINIVSTAEDPILATNGNYIPAVAETMSILMSVQRATGTGSVTVDPTAGQEIDIIVQDCGADPGDTGVDL